MHAVTFNFLINLFQHQLDPQEGITMVSQWYPQKITPFVLSLKMEPSEPLSSINCMYTSNCFFCQTQTKSKIYTRLSSLLVWFWFGKKSMHALRLEDTGFFRLQSIKVLWGLQFVGYLRTLSLKFQKATSKIEYQWHFRPPTTLWSQNWWNP